jgi:hypothetical protein
MISRLSAISLVFAGLAVATIPGYASMSKANPPVAPPAASKYFFSEAVVTTKGGQPTTLTQRAPWLPSTATTSEERTRAAAEASKVKEPTKIKKASPTMWTAQYKLYVNCPTAPSDVNFTGPFAIQDAVFHALPYTTIQVCYGFNGAGGVVIPTSYIKIEGQGDHQGDQTILGGLGGDFGILMLGSYDVVENLTFQNLEFGVLTGVILQDQFNVVDQNWFNTVELGVGSLLGNNTLIENNTFDLNTLPIIDAGGVSETITNNNVSGNEPVAGSDGIFLIDTIDSTVTSNVVANSWAGLDLVLGNSYATVESNHFDGNAYGILDVDFNSGNLFKKNQVNGNFFDGIYSDFTTGLDDLPSNEGVNKFETNTTLGNGSIFGGCFPFPFGVGCDILDYTAGYPGPAEGNNDETANYYSGNTGDLYSSWPLDIYQQ